MREEAVSRRVGRDASGGPDAGSRASSGRSGRVRRRGRRPRTAPGTTSTRARPRSGLSERATRRRVPRLVSSRTAGRRRSAYERTVSAPCGYRTMSEQSRIARSLEPRMARKAASAHPRSSPSRTLSCDVMSVVVIRTPAPGRPMCLGTAPTALGSAPVLGGTPRATRRALSPVRDAAARVTGGDE